MDLNKLYQSRMVTPEEAARQIKSGDRIFLTGNCSVPQKTLTPAKMTMATPTVSINSPIWPKAWTLRSIKRSIKTPITADTIGATNSASQKFPVM